MPFTLGRRPALDGIRGCAIVGVLGLHAGEVLKGGYIGVQVFFVLSGFVITGVLLEEARATRAISLIRFYARRGLRLLPALCVVIAFVAVFAALHSEQRWTGELTRDSTSTLFYFANWLSTGAANQFDPLSHMWSLSVEEQFYLVLPPLLALFAVRRVSYRALLVVCVVGAVASAVVRAALITNGGVVNRVYFGTDTRIDAVLIGCAAAVLAYGGWLPTGARVRTGIRVIAIAGCASIIGVAYAVPRTERGLYTYGLLVVALLSAAIIADVIVSPEGALARALAWRPLRRVGVISYGIYLWHLPLLFVIRTALPTASNAVVAPLMIAASVAVAEASYRYLETPFLRLKDRLGARAGHVQRYPRYVKIAP
jgi:peptidoglycan/LPS O-acetylase OafA/YrhL